MGASEFMVRIVGKTDAEAFSLAVKNAQHQSGHGGYTGTIAEKDSFVTVGEPLTFREAQDLAEKMLDKDDARISDKWGPAGCIQLVTADGDGAGFLFFGRASS